MANPIVGVQPFVELLLKNSSILYSQASHMHHFKGFQARQKKFCIVHDDDDILCVLEKVGRACIE